MEQQQKNQEIIELSDKHSFKLDNQVVTVQEA